MTPGGKIAACECLSMGRIPHVNIFLQNKFKLHTWTSDSFIEAQFETLHAHSSMRYGFEWPLDWAYSVNGSHWFSSLEQLDMEKSDLKVLAI